MKHLVWATVFLLLVTGHSFRGAVAVLEAQELASSFEQLAVLVKPGDKITVVDLNGRKAEGRIEKLSREALTLDTAAGPRQLGELDVREIRQRRSDSLMNGAIIGAVAATGYVVTMIALLHGTFEGDIIVDRAILGTAMFAGMGAAAGAGIDALIARRQVIYRRGPGATSVAVTPLVGRGRAGASITVRF